MKSVFIFLLNTVLLTAQVASCSGHHNILITWAPSSTPTVSLYNVYRATQTGGPYTFIGNTSGLSYVDSVVIDGTTYYWVIRAYDSVMGESANSPETHCQTPNQSSTQQGDGSYVC